MRERIGIDATLQDPEWSGPGYPGHEWSVLETVHDGSFNHLYGEPLALRANHCVPSP